MKTRYFKVMRDLTSDYGKSLMLVIAIALGVFGIGAILGGYSVIKREMTANYLGTVPASATLEIQGDISASLLDSIRRYPGLQEAERHATLLSRMKVDGKWYPLLLFIVDDFADKRTNKVRHLSGAPVPPVGTMLVERSAYGMMRAKEGDELLIKTPHGVPRKIKLSGTVHDPGLAPAWQEQAGYGYMTLSTLRLLGETRGFDQLRMLVREQPYSREHITETARAVADDLTRAGYDVHEIQVPPPGKHPHQGQMNAVMSMFVMFSYLILILGSILVATAVATMMVKQVRQIGVMKTIGASAFQVAGLYVIMVIVLCAAALVVAIPLSRFAAAAFYDQIAALLNLEIGNRSIPYWVPLLQVASGILIPVIAAASPVIRASRIPVRKALDHYGVNQKAQGNRSWAVRLSQAGFFGEVFRLSIRNVFRQRSRLIMTLGLLAAGGAMFMTALNVSEAWEDNLKKIYLQRLYDLEIRLDSVIHGDAVLAKIRAIPGVTNAEGWIHASAAFSKGESFEVTHTYPDKGHGSFMMLALPVPTQFLNPAVTEGNWLSNGASNDVVLNQSARALSPGVKTGDRVRLSVDGAIAEWNVVGFTEDVGSSATAYVSAEAFSKRTNMAGKIKMLRISYTDRSRDNVVQKSREVEALLEKENIPVSTSMPVWLLHNAVAAHMRVLVNSLIGMAVLMAFVGTLGLMSAMSMNVLERTREIGVMRAIGATPKKIRNLVVWEGLIIGIISIFIAFVLSLFLSDYIGRFIGTMAFRTPLSLTISMLAFGLWVLIIIVGSYVATLYPARRANNITTREALAYE